MTVLQKSSAITYTTKSPAERQKSNLCRHIISETRYSGNPTSTERLTYDGQTYYYISALHHTISSAGHALAVAAAKVALNISDVKTAYLAANGQAHINAAAIKLRPDLTTVSVPNFLIEIASIKALFKLWKTSVGIAKNLAGAHLNYKFGWKPTIGDLTAVVEGVRSLKDRIAAFEKTLNVLFHRQTTLLDETTTISGTLKAGHTEYQCSWTASVHRTCTAHFAWRPQPLQAVSDLKKNLLGLLDTLGFELNPRIIWDALPFTFVIDWFFGVGSFLERYRVDTLELPIVYVDSYLQYKEVMTIESSVQTGFGNAAVHPWARSGGWVTSETYFQRMPIFPDYSVLTGIGWRMPTLNQATLLVSLAVVLKR